MIDNAFMHAGQPTWKKMIVLESADMARQTRFKTKQL
jgi:hypothetical protein